MHKHFIKGFALAVLLAATTAVLITQKKKGPLDKIKIIENDILKKFPTLKKHGIFINTENWQILDISEYRIVGTNLQRIEVLVEANNGQLFEYIAHFNTDIYKKQINKKELIFKNPISKSFIKKSTVSDLTEWENIKNYGV